MRTIIHVARVDSVYQRNLLLTLTVVLNSELVLSWRWTI